MPEYPRGESNSHLRFRKPPFYPLNYGDDVKGKSKKEERRSPEIMDQKTEGKIQMSYCELANPDLRPEHFRVRAPAASSMSFASQRLHSRGGILIIAHQYRVPLLSAKAKAREGPANPPISVLFSDVRLSRFPRCESLFLL